MDTNQPHHAPDEHDAPAEGTHHVAGDSPDAGQGGPRWSGRDAAAGAQPWLTQLQAIIDNLATQSAPVVREVGAKAAEIAALAAERAGPLAQRAAEATAQVSVRVAERSRGLAAELRRGPEGAPGGGKGSAGAADSTEWKMSDDSDQDSTAPQGPTV